PPRADARLERILLFGLGRGGAGGVGIGAIGEPRRRAGGPRPAQLRLLDARAGIDGVFHPPYIAVHLGTAALLRRPSLLVLKGGGGEAERNPLKPVAAFLQQAAAPAREMALPAFLGQGGSAPDGPALD